MPVSESDAIIVMTTMPDRAAALRLAQDLVERRNAACVSVLEQADSIYRWKGEVEHSQEVPMLIKTRRGLYSEIESAIAEAHPYELPEIVAVPVVLGSSGYLDWIAAETSTDSR